MRELVNCPFCKKPLNAKLIADFYFCKECEVAVRQERDMPLSGVNIYNQNWVKSQEESKANFARAANSLKEIKKLTGIRTILDIGSGTGILVDMLNLNSYVSDGVDNSTEAIMYAKSHKRGNFYLSSVENYKSQYKYDLIVINQLIEHLRNPDVFFKNIRTIFRPGGYIYIETPNLYSCNKKSIWRRRIGGIFYGTDHRICYTAKSLTCLLRDNNFEIYKVFSKTYSPTIFVEIIRTLSAFGKKAEIQEESLVAESSKNKLEHHLGKNAVKNIHLIDSFIVNALLFIPNRISEINGRGNQLIVIAKKKIRPREVDYLIVTIPDRQDFYRSY